MRRLAALTTIPRARESGAVGDRQRARLAAAQVVEQRGARGRRRRVDERVEQAGVVGGEVVEVGRRRGRRRRARSAARAARPRRRCAGGARRSWRRSRGGRRRRRRRRRGRRRPWPPRSCSARRPGARRRRPGGGGPSPPGRRARASGAWRRGRARPRPTSRTTSSPRCSEWTSRPSRSSRASADARDVARDAEPGLDLGVVERRSRAGSCRPGPRCAGPPRRRRRGLVWSSGRRRHEPLREPVSRRADTRLDRAWSAHGPRPAASDGGEPSRAPAAPLRHGAPWGRRDPTQPRCSEDRAELSSNTVSTDRRPNGP